MQQAECRSGPFRGLADFGPRSPVAALVWTGEPAISDLLGDPIARALMIADRVKPEELDLLLATAASERWR